MANSALEDEGLGDLVKDAIKDVEELVKIEIALAKQEIRYDVEKLKTAFILFGIAAVGAILGLSMALVALLIGIGGGVAAALALSALLFGVALVVGAIGYRMIPSAPVPERTAENVEHQARMLKERIA